MQRNLGELVFVRVADYAGYSRQGCDFFGSALGVASRDDDLGVGILAVDAADGGAGIVIGGGGDGAGVEHDEFGAGDGGSAVESLLLELALDRGAVGLGGAASEILDVESSHGTSVT